VQEKALSTKREDAQRVLSGTRTFRKQLQDDGEGENWMPLL